MLIVILEVYQNVLNLVFSYMFVSSFNLIKIVSQLN